MAGRNAYFPQPSEAFEAEKDAFQQVFGAYTRCATFPAHYIGGQYLSRAHRGDPGAQPPIVPVSKADQWRAFKALDDHLFSSPEWSVPASVLRNLGYSEWSGYGYVEFDGYGNLPKWAYDPPARHDFDYYGRIAGAQADVLKEMLSAPVLARIAAGPSETADPHPMQLSDLFGWLHAGIYRELSGHAGSIDPLRTPRRTPGHSPAANSCSSNGKRARLPLTPPTPPPAPTSTCCGPALTKR